MSKICRCVHCGHCIFEGNGEYFHIKGGEKGESYTICPICKCPNPEPNLNDEGDCYSFKEYSERGMKGECTK